VSTIKVRCTHRLTRKILKSGLFQNVSFFHWYTNKRAVKGRHWDFRESSIYIHTHILNHQAFLEIHGKCCNVTLCQVIRWQRHTLKVYTSPLVRHTHRCGTQCVSHTSACTIGSLLVSKVYSFQTILYVRKKWMSVREERAGSKEFVLLLLYAWRTHRFNWTWVKQPLIPVTCELGKWSAHHSYTYTVCTHILRHTQVLVNTRTHKHFRSSSKDSCRHILHIESFTASSLMLL